MDIQKYKVNGIAFSQTQTGVECTIAQCGIRATYPFESVTYCGKAKYLLMDLDGTTVKSEEFWTYVIEKVVQKLLQEETFRFEDADMPYICGFSTGEHLSYCIEKYKIPTTLTEATELYHKITRFELNEIMEGRGNVAAFRPREGLKEFLEEVKKRGIKIGLVTSGLDYKALPEIVSAFRVLDMGNPVDFYDAIITGGNRKERGVYGTLGELAVKPHPWVYAEIAFGLGVKDKTTAIVLEDSSAGLIAGRLAGFPVIGFNDGNIQKSGMSEQCYAMVDTLGEVLALL